MTRDAVGIADGRELPSGLTIWAAGFGIPDLAARSGLSTDVLGRLLTDETLTAWTTYASSRPGTRLHRQGSRCG